MDTTRAGVVREALGKSRQASRGGDGTTGSGLLEPTASPTRGTARSALSEAWVPGVLAADPEAFRLFYEGWLPVVLRFARRRTDSEHAARALARRILRRAIEALPGWRARVPLGAWMRAVAEESLAEHAG